jgi:hypothetical protein
MADDLRRIPDASITALLSGIIDDAQELFAQQLALLKHEVKDEIRQTKEAARSLAWGVGVAASGGFLLSLMLPLLLEWAVYPALPLWACFGIVGGLLAVIGGVWVYTARRKFAAIEPIPQSAEALKENLHLKP